MKPSLRIISLLTAILFCVTAAACAKKDGDGDGTSDKSETAVGTDTVGEFDLLPKDGCDGKTYTILNAYVPNIEGSLGPDFASDDAADSAISNAVTKRNMAVEDYFGITVENVPTESFVDDVISLVGSGDDIYDTVYGVYSGMSVLASGGYLSNIRGIPGMQLDSEWWNASAQENLTIDGRQYIALNDTPYSTLISTHCMFFNKRYAGDILDMDNPYDLVFSGNWTIDNLIRLTKDASRDNGDKVWNEDDSYGLSVQVGSFSMFGVAFDESVYPITIKNGEIVETNEEKWNDIIKKLYTLCYNNNNGTFIDCNFGSGVPLTLFCSDQALFYVGALCEAPMYFRDMESDFGILPLPKYNEQQKDYRTALSGGTLLMGVTSLPDDEHLKFIGVITEALAIKSHNILRTAVYETVFDNQLARDEESKRTMDIIVDSLYADFVFVHATGPSGYYGEIHMLLELKSDAYTSARKRNKSRVENFYQSILDVYHGLGE